MKNVFGCHLTVTIYLFLLMGCVAGTWVAEEIQATSSPADLTFQLPIKAGSNEYVQFKAAVPGFGIGGAKLLPKSSRTRFMVGVQFTSKSVRSARVEITLLASYQDPKPVHRFTHIEELGPERLTKKGPSLDMVRNWNDERALWFDLPAEVRAAEAFRVEVYLQYAEEKKGL